MHITKPQKIQQVSIHQKPSAPKHNKFVFELSKPHPQFKGVQKIRREEIGELLKKQEQKQQSKEGKYLDIKRYKFRPDVWELNGEILYKSPYENIDEPTNEYVKKLYDGQKKEIKEKKIQILELQKKAKQKREEREKQEMEKRPKNKRKYSNDLQEHELNQLNQQMDKLNKQINSDQEEEEEEEESKSDNEQENEDDDQQQEDEEDFEQQQQDDDQEEDEDQCQQIDDFGDIDDMKEDASFEENDISQSFVNQSGVSNKQNKQNAKFQSDFANQLDNAFSQLIGNGSQTTNSSNVQK